MGFLMGIITRDFMGYAEETTRERRRRLQRSKEAPPTPVAEPTAAEIELFELLLDKEPLDQDRWNRMTEALERHEIPPDRIQRLIREVKGWPRRDNSPYAVDASGRRRKL